MAVKRIIFSPTGGTDNVAKLIANNINKDHSIIDLCDSTLDLKKIRINKNDTVIIALPSYGGRAPSIAIN